jgi:hypothetical protein
MAAAFRVFVVLSALAYTAWFIAPYAPMSMADQAADLASWEGYGAYMAAGTWIHWPIFALWMIAAAGLWFFQAWARLSYAILVVLGIGLVPLSGFMVAPPWEALVYSLTLTLDGLVLGMAYFSTLRSRFGESAA